MGERDGVTVVAACVWRGRGGSPTAVLADDPALSDDERRAIVRRAGTSHGAFVTQAGDVSRVRFFTAGGELTNCGHGTIAAQAVLLDRSGVARRHGRQRTGGRTFDTTAVRRADGIEVWFDQGLVELRDGAAESRDGILAALGLGPGDLAGDDELCVADPGTPRLLVPVRDRATLLALRPDFGRLAAECRRAGYLGCFVHTAVEQDGVTDAARMFAPAIGVDEDVVNANSAGCLAAHRLAGRGRGRVAVEQGVAVGRPSLVPATAAPTPAGIRTRVGGVVATVS